MTSAPTVVLLAVAAVAAVGDWVAVARSWRRVGFVLKPATLALLVAAASTAHPGREKPWIVVALALGLAGDVFLLRTPPELSAGPPARTPLGADESTGGGLSRWFVAGLGAFLVGHGFWMVAFVQRGLHPLQAAAGVLVALGVAGLALRPVLRAVRADGGRVLAGLVATYSLVLGAMAVLAVATGLALVAAGGIAFLVSDAVLAHDRFVRPVRHGQLAVMITYHLAQVLMLIGLLRR